MTDYKAEAEELLLRIMSKDGFRDATWTENTMSNVYKTVADFLRKRDEKRGAEVIITFNRLIIKDVLPMGRYSVSSRGIEDSALKLDILQLNSEEETTRKQIVFQNHKALATKPSTSAKSKESEEKLK